MKTTIIALSAAALIAAAPGVLAQNVSSKTPDQQHKVTKKRPQVFSGYAPWRVVHAKGAKTGYPRVFQLPAQRSQRLYIRKFQECWRRRRRWWWWHVSHPRLNEREHERGYRRPPSPAITPRSRCLARKHAFLPVFLPHGIPRPPRPRNNSDAFTGLAHTSQCDAGVELTRANG